MTEQNKDKEFRVDRFTFNPDEASAKPYAEYLQEQIDNNLAAMKTMKLTDQQFKQLSQKNIELQNELFKQDRTKE